MTTSPETFGLPLKETLHGYRKLRVGDHRVVFKVDAKTVWILAVMHRRNADERAARRPPTTTSER